MSNRYDDISATTLFVFMLVLLAPAVLWSAYVAQTLWAWFVVPLGPDELSLFHAAGLGLFTRWFTGLDDSPDERSNTEKAVRYVNNSFIVPAFILFFGYVYHTLS